MKILLPFDGGPAALRAIGLLAGYDGDVTALAATVLNVQPRTEGADLVMAGTRGLGAAHHALVGSVALKAAVLSPVPVLLVS